MEPVPLCETCGKVVRPIREGSLTSWLFFDNRCACALQSKILNGPQLSQGRQDPPPQLDDGYELLNLLGQGGMSRVYKVRERESNKIVACKVMDSTMAQDAQAVARFEKEAKACLALSHPNLVVVHGSSITKSGEPYLIMDYLDGITLQDLLKQNGRLKPERALSLMKEVADALAAAHQTGIIHRDLKPSNIMVTTCGDKEEVKVLDFGIARIMPVGVDHSQNLTSTGEIIGSPFYMSPEQCKGVEIDERSDIYSFGCVLYEMLAGTPPFVGKNAMQTVLGHLTEFPKSIIDKKSGIDSRLENVVLKCLEKDPQERYRSVAELSHDLQLLKAGLKPALQPGAELVKRRRKDRQKKIVRVTTYTLGGIVGIVLLCLGYALITLHESNRPIEEMNMQVQKNPDDHDALVRRGFYFKNHHRYTEAIADLSRGIKLIPNSPHPYRWRAQCYNALNQPEKALADINTSISLRPGDGRSWIDKGCILVRLERYKEAIAAFDQALSKQAGMVRPNKYVCHCQKAKCFFNLKQYEKTIDSATKSLEFVDQSDPYPYDLRGNAYMELEQWQEALKDFGKALMIEPGSPLFLERRAIVRTYLHDFRGAMSDINEANSLAPGDKRILDNRDWIIRYRNQVLPDVSSRSKTE